MYWWYNLRVAQKERDCSSIKHDQTRSFLCNTLPAVCIGKVVIRKSGEELYNKTYQTPLVPQRIVLEPNLHYGRQDTTGNFWRWKVQGNLSWCIRLQDSRIAPFSCPAAGSHPQGSSPKVDLSIRDASKSRSVESRPEAKSRVQPIPRAVEGHDLQHGKHGVLRNLRDHSKHTMRQLSDILAEMYCILHMLNMLTNFGQSSKKNQQ